MPNRATFLIDGFNLYHSVVAASKDLKGAPTKWLDIRAMCCSYLPAWGKDYALEEIYYFSALAKHREVEEPGVVAKHERFIQCLEATGIKKELSDFKPKFIPCKTCGAQTERHEEKETDVAIAIKMFELFHSGLCDTVVIMSGDTDLAPAVRTCQRIFPANKIIFLFPYKRMNRELKKLCPLSVKIRKENYPKHQFPSPFDLINGDQIPMPPGWGYKPEKERTIRIQLEFFILKNFRKTLRSIIAPISHRITRLMRDSLN